MPAAGTFRFAGFLRFFGKPLARRRWFGRPRQESPRAWRILRTYCL